MRSRTTTRSRTSSEPRTARAATALGTALNRIGRGAPGTLGPLLVAAGLWFAWAPLGIIALGLILWALDRWVP